MKVLILALASILVSVAAQFCLKAGMTSASHATTSTATATVWSYFWFLKEPLVILGLGLYAFGAMLWLSVLSEWDVSKAYPLVGLGFALAVAIGFLIGEDVSLGRVVGVALICAGVFVVSKS